MSSKQFMSSIHPSQGRQFQKFQLPHHRHSTTLITQTDHSLKADTSLNQDKLQKFVFQKIAQVERENEKLLNIANQLNRSSHSFSLNENLTSLVYPIQEQMKSAFNQLIQSIQQFYIDIDSKIKQIGAYLTTLSGVETHETSKKDHDDLIFMSNHYQIPNQNYHQANYKQKRVDQRDFRNSKDEQETIRSINMKIQVMQRDLEQTKSNQKKLMEIIEKLVEKYEITNETTMVKEDLFLRNKVQGMESSRGEGNISHRTQKSQQNFILNSDYGQYSGHGNGQGNTQQRERYVQGETFSKPNYPHHHNPIHNLSHNHFIQHHSTMNSARNLTNQVNGLTQVRSIQKPQRNVSSGQTHHNDYSIYQELNKIEQPLNNHHHMAHNQRSFNTHNNNHQTNNNSFSQPKDYFIKSKTKPPKPNPLPSKIQSSMLSVNSYAYSASIAESDSDPCFIKKLYSKQPTLNKVSLKNTNPNKTVFQLNRPGEQTPIDSANKNHREAFLINQLKKNN